MEKKKFFESFIKESSDEGDVVDSFSSIRRSLESVAELVTDERERQELIPLFNEVLLRAWMFDELFNGNWAVSEDEANSNIPLWPLTAVYLYGEPLILSRSYCRASGLSPAEVRSFAHDGKLYDEIYSGRDIEKAKEWVKKLQSGKGYRDLDLSMKHIHRTTFWNSYGGAGERMEIRIGRDTNNEEIKDEFFQGNTMNSMSVLQNLYVYLSKADSVSPRIGNELFWIGEYLSLFDFFWNHGGFIAECLFLSKKFDRSEEVSGHYNAMFAKLFEQSFKRREDFKKFFLQAHGEKQSDNIIQLLRNMDKSLWMRFFRKNGKPVARAFWRHFECPYDIFPERPIFGIAAVKPIEPEERGFWKRVWKKKA